jgi:hypothetical protein
MTARRERAAERLEADPSRLAEPATGAFAPPAQTLFAAPSQAMAARARLEANVDVSEP